MVLLRKIRNARIKFTNYLNKKKKLKKLKVKDFTVISNNCWAGTAIYQPFGLKYNTPTVGLFFFDEDYIKFLENLKTNISLALKFIPPQESKYYDKISKNGTQIVNYPIALLGKDIEVHFLHYKSEAEAKEKWERRLQRINWNRILIKMSIRDSFSNYKDVVERFQNLPFQNKICFVPELFDKNNTTIIEVPELKTLNIIGGDETEYTLKYIKIENLINSIR